jgi:hypothetical protein
MSGRSRRQAASLLVPVLALLVPVGVQSAAAGTSDSSSLGALVLPAVGPGYAVLSQGPIDPSTFASSAPDPSAVSSALSTLGDSVRSYQRTWLDTARVNAVQDMVFRFPSAGSAQIFLQSARRSLQAGKIVSSGALPGVPGAHRVTYFGATDQSGVGQAITLRVGNDVALLSFFSASAGNADPITQADATEITVAQGKALGAASTSTAVDTRSASGIGSWLVVRAIALLVLVLLLVGVLVVRRRRARGPLPPASPT